MSGPRSLSAVLRGDVCLAGERVLVRRPTIEDAEALVDLLRNDHVLHKAAGMSGRGPSSATEFLVNLARWADDRKAVCLAAVSRQLGRAVGLISLSHIDLVARTGRIGTGRRVRAGGRG